MSMDNIQLKQEDMLGDKVVLTDINPVTNTQSVDDPVRGEKLDTTLDRIWQAINNKLSRVVNSVNGRTGVVVLTSDDVGLGAVDNVSFADIKSWVIEQIENAFANKHLQFYTNIAQAIQVSNSNDRALAWAPFYCDYYDDEDKRAVIGVFIWDNAASQLSIDYRMINTIGFSDNSIIYRMNSTDYDPGQTDPTRHIPVGGIGVNIFKEENPEDQILYLENGSGKEDSGLRIDHNMIGSRVYYEETPYGVYDPIYGLPGVNTGYMLWRWDDGESVKGDAVRIFIDGTQIPVKYLTNGQWSYNTEPTELVSDQPFYLSKRWSLHDVIRPNDVIIMKFSNFIRYASANKTAVGVCLDFSRCQPCIGTIVKSSEPGIEYDIFFHALNPNTNGYGITTMTSHQDRDVKNTQLGVNILAAKSTPDGRVAGQSDAWKYRGFDINMSGLMTHAGAESVTSVTNHRNTQYIQGVHGPWNHPISDSNDWQAAINDPVTPGSIHITMDGSLCVYPYYQSLATTTRLGSVPKWVADKFYSESGGSYTVLTSKPADWSYNFFSYYVKDENDEYIHVEGIKKSYSIANYSTGIGESAARYQRCIGSLMASNAIFDAWRSNSGTNVQYQYMDAGSAVTDPTGLNQSDSLGGTRSSLSVNLYKMCGSLYTSDTLQEAGKLRWKCGYQFANLSGLRTNTEDSVSDDEAELYSHPIDRHILFGLGLCDYKDAYGNDRKSYHMNGEYTSGLSVNVGRFLEITPLTTYRADKYWDGGKVQVRIGKGLCGEVQIFDVTDIIKRGSSEIADYMPFDYKELQERWWETPEEFYVSGNDSENTSKIYFTKAHFVLDEKPDDWDDSWYKYEYNIGTNEEPDYVFLPATDEAIGFDETSATYMGPYYRPIIYAGGLFGSRCIDDVRREYETYPDTTNMWSIFWERPTNRITIDTDPETLSFNEDGKLTVVGGIGGNITNIRFVDSSGVYADTYHGEEIPETEQIILGDGFLLNGSDIVFPEDMRLPNTSNVELSNRIANIFASGLTTLETCKFISLKGTDLNVIPPVVYNINWVYDHKAEIYEKLKAIQNSGDLYSYYNAYQEAATLQRSVISDTGTYQFGDATYNIGNTEYSRSKVRSYITGNVASIQQRVANIIRSIRVEMAANPSDAEKIEQYVADHYGIGTISSNDQLIGAMQTVSIYNPGEPITSTTFLPLDWLFGFFTNQIMINNKYYSILEGVFNYTQVANRPNGWNTGYASYFKSVNSEKKPVTSIDLAAKYRPGIFYTRDSGTGVFTLVTSASATQSTIIDSYYFKNAFILQTSEPVDWADNWNKYYITEDPDGDNRRFTHVNTATKPTWAANTYYTENASGDVVGYEKVTAAPAFTSDERGAAAPDTIPTNPIICAPVWGEETYYADDQGTVLEEMPANWYTEYANYWTRTGSEGDYTYSHVLGVHFAFRSYDGPYYSRSLVNS